MDSKEFKELLKKCFGKQKDDKYHAVAMLIIYGMFVFILILAIRIGGSSTNLEDNSPSQTPDLEIVEKDDNNEVIDSKVIHYNNYSYSYTITYNGVSEVFLGKKTSDKEKFTYVKDSAMAEYAILDNNFLILENDIYHITQKPNRFFKYCNVGKILSLIEKEDTNTSIYNISNIQLESAFDDMISIDNKKDNTISLNKKDGILKTIDLDLSNYISALEGTNLILTIHMELNNIGEIDDFQISVK